MSVARFHSFLPRARGWTANSRRSQLGCLDRRSQFSRASADEPARASQQTERLLVPAQARMNPAHAFHTREANETARARMNQSTHVACGRSRLNRSWMALSSPARARMDQRRPRAVHSCSSCRASADEPIDAILASLPERSSPRVRGWAVVRGHHRSSRREIPRVRG